MDWLFSSLLFYVVVGSENGPCPPHSPHPGALVLGDQTCPNGVQGQVSRLRIEFAQFWIVRPGMDREEGRPALLLPFRTGKEHLTSV